MQVHVRIMEGFEDIQQGRFFESTGDWKKDKELFKQKEAKGWQ